MKTKKLQSILLCLFFFIYGSQTLIAQCPSEDIYLDTQQQVDDFSTNYPGCTNLTGSLTITGSDITNLNGLSTIETIDGNLSISTSELNSLTGLNNLSSIVVDIDIGNTKISNYSGLGALESVGYFYSYSNSSLVNFSGLSSLTDLGTNLYIANNPALTSLTGLSGVTTINGGINISENIVLTDISALASLSGITSVNINGNSQLSQCAISSICTYEESNSGTYTNNASGCNGEDQVEASCGNCPDDIFLDTQAEVDNFNTLYGTACGTNLTGNLSIYGSDITNLNGLSTIETIEGSLSISASELTSLNGLNNLISVDEIIDIGNTKISNYSGLGALESVGYFSSYYNSSLVNFSGLSSLTDLGTYLYINGNPVLASLTGLSGVTTINGGIEIYENIVLTDISALASLSGITSVSINGNSQLSQCAISSICTYEESNSGYYTNNASGCNGEGQVEASCGNCPDDIFLDTQAEVDNFNTLYGTACGTNLTGSLSIYGSDITNLNGLSTIETIEGSLSISASELTSLNGLNNLISVDESIDIGNTKISNYSGLGALESVGYFSSYYNSSLVNFSGLSSLTDLGTYLYINGNPVLASLTGLSGVTTINGGIDIYENIVLTDISALASLSGITSVSINGNSQLSQCAISSICTYEENNSGNYSNNGSGCNGENQVEASCGNCPDNIYLDTQAEVDNFNTLYGTACGTNLTGNLTITGSDITNLNGLSTIETIDGYLSISTSELTSLNGLNNLISVDDGININNTKISNYSGLGALESVGYFYSYYNSSLVNFSGLSSLTDLGTNLYIDGNPALTSLTGLSGVTTINGGIDIYENIVLTDISALASLSGITSVNINGNSQLSQCAISSICTYEENNSGNYSNNGSGCNGENQVEASCGNCPDNIYLDTQAEVDNFNTLYGTACGTNLTGNLTITGSDITNLNGLSTIETIDGYLSISTSELTSLNGLNNLISVDDGININNTKISNYSGLGALESVGYFYSYYNSSLVNFSGLSSLTDLGTYLYIDGNPALTSLTGLSGVTTINGSIEISNNIVLTDISALASLSGITSVNINGNSQLSQCAISSICTYEESNSGNYSNNGSGCNGEGQVEYYCGAEITAASQGNEFSLESVNIHTDNSNTNEWVHIIDSNGNIGASINANGNNLGSISSCVYIDGGDTHETNSGEPYLRRVLMISPEDQPTSDVTMRFYFQSDEIEDLISAIGSGITTIEDMIIKKITGNDCNPEFSGGDDVSDLQYFEFQNGYYAEFSVSSFSTFVGGSSGVLPVKLIDFTAEALADANLLQWQTASESNSSHFEVERSSDGIHYTKIGVVQAAGNSNNSIAYEYADQSPLANNYYRLHMVDIDGSSEYSNVVQVNRAQNTALVAYPNPATNVVNLGNVALDKIESITMISTDGQVREMNIATQLDVSQLNSGLYLLQVKLLDENKPIITKIIIK